MLLFVLNCFFSSVFLIISRYKPYLPMEYSRLQTLFLLKMRGNDVISASDLLSSYYANQSAIDKKWVVVGDAGFKGLGLFSCRPIPNGCFIGSYEGEVLTHRQYRARYPKGESVYVFLVGDDRQRREKRYIDAADESKSNLARYMNHDAISPNVDYLIETVLCRSRAKVIDYKVLLYSIRDINIGEELVFDYGSQYPLS